MFDGYTLPLRHITFIANCSTTGTQVVGFTGEILYYNLVNKGTTDNPKYYLTCWNNTAIPTELLGTSGTNYWQWRPGSVAVHDGTQGFSLNVSITSVNGPRNSLLNETGTIRAVREGQYVIVGTAGRNDERGDVQGYLMAISLERGHEGQKLWDTTFSDPYADTASNASITLQSVYPDQGVFICGNTVTLGGSKYLKYWGYDLYTGKQIWVTDPEPQENYYSQQINVYQDKLITSGYGGVVIAYDLKTGKQVWNFTAINIGSESPYGNFPINIFAVCDGKLYTLTGEHSITQPMWRGPNIRCINATTGEEIWNLLGMGADNGAHLTGQYMQMGDGKVVGLNYFDNELYCIGPGPSATTVSAPQIIPTLGSSVMLTGTVTDQTATGRRNDNYNFDFTLQGTPAISDASMGRWMEYMYENQIMPKNATGVPVTLSAIDPNGNYIQIGQTTSDSHGNYGLTFTPQVPGTYQILASFAGSKAYSPSSATTYLSISDIAATPTPTITPQAQSVADLYFVPAIIGLFVFVAIIGAVIILMLRKRP
jgi:outer membrane protein assembly factor BamB